MLSVVIKPNAERAILAVADFIDSKNTPDSSKKWVVVFKKSNKEFAVHYIIYGPKLK